MAAAGAGFAAKELFLPQSRDLSLRDLYPILDKAHQSETIAGDNPSNVVTFCAPYFNNGNAIHPMGTAQIITENDSGPINQRKKIIAEVANFIFLCKEIERVANFEWYKRQGISGINEAWIDAQHTFPLSGRRILTPDRLFVEGLLPLINETSKFKSPYYLGPLRGAVESLSRDCVCRLIIERVYKDNPDLMNQFNENKTDLLRAKPADIQRYIISKHGVSIFPGDGETTESIALQIIERKQYQKTLYEQQQTIETHAKGLLSKFFPNWSVNLDKVRLVFYDHLAWRVQFNEVSPEFAMIQSAIADGISDADSGGWAEPPSRDLVFVNTRRLEPQHIFSEVIHELGHKLPRVGYDELNKYKIGFVWEGNEEGTYGFLNETQNHRIQAGIMPVETSIGIYRNAGVILEDVDQALERINRLTSLYYYLKSDSVGLISVLDELFEYSGAGKEFLLQLNSQNYETARNMLRGL